MDNLIEKLKGKIVQSSTRYVILKLAQNGFL